MKKIKLLLAAMAAMVGLGVNAQTWTGNDVANGTFYLYNVGAQKFLNNGDPLQNWGTNAYLQAGFGLDVVIAEVSTGVYTIETKIKNNDTDHYLGSSTWCDAGATNWTFRAVDGETKTYQIIYNGQYLMANEDLNDVEMVGDPGSRVTSTYWKLVTEDDFKAAMEAKAYSTTDPMDVSIFIKGRSFARNDGRNSTWVTSHNGGNWTWIGASNNKYYGNEAWNNTFDVHQAIEGLPDGTYEVQCSGFGTNGTTYIYGNTKTGQLQTDNSTSYGNSKEAKWKAIHEDNAFAGQSTGTFTLSGGNLTVGIKRETNSSQDWAVWDEFRLYYYGLDLSEFAATLATAVAEAEAVEGTIPTAAYNTLAAVVAEQNQTYTSAAAYTAAADAIVAATNTAKAMQANYSRYKSIRTAVLAINDEIDVNTDVEDATNNDDIDAAVGTLRAAFTTYLAGANITDDQIDITAVLIDNASPGISGTTDYWENSGNPSLEHQLYEYWNASGATTTQTIATELPAGYYTLTAVAYTRDNMTATLHAGTNTINLVGCGTVNDRNGGNNWIAQGNGNGVNELTFNLTDATSNLEIGLTADSSTGDHWMCWRSFKLEYLGTNPVSLMTGRYNDALVEAETARDNTEYANVTGSERTDLLNAIAATPSTVAEYETAIENMNDAVAAFKAAKTNYDALVREIAKANALGFDGSTYAATSSTTAATALTNTQSLKVNEYAYVTSQYPYSVALSDTWNSTGTNTEDATFSNEHWSGTTHEYKNQKDNENPAQGWHANSWTLDFNQNVTLPAGSYVFKVAGRRASGNATTMSLVVKQGDTVLGTVSDFPEGSSGLGINTSGETDFTTGEGHTYANGGNGFGWEWRYVKFELNNLATVNIGIHAEATAKYQWISFGDYTLQADNADVAELLAALAEYDAALLTAQNARDNATYDNVDGKEKADLIAAIDADGSLDKTSTSAVEAATTALTNATTAFTAADAVTNYGNLVSAIASAQAIVDANVNVGNGVFQIPTSAQTTLSDAIATASSTKSNAETTATTAATAATTLNEAITAYNNTALTAPADNEVFNVMITTEDNYGFKDTPLTFKADNGGGFFAKGVGVDANRAQQITFTQQTGNQYILSMVNAEGIRVYIATNKTANNEGNKNQIRLTTDAAKALAVEIVPTATTGVFNLRNTEANALLGCQDGDANATGGFYTCGAHNDFVITPATKPIVEVHVAAGKLATRIFPFKPTLPEGVAAYSCAANTGTSLTLEVVDDPAANVPYILYSESGCASTNLTGWGTATADSYTEDYLTGVYTRTVVPVGSYVLQTQNGTQAFYKVNQEGAYSSAYRAYVTVPSAEVKAFGFTLDDMETAIEAARAEGENTVTLRYNVAGQQMQNAQKGLNIIKMEDGSIRKVLVK